MFAVSVRSGTNVMFKTAMSVNTSIFVAFDILRGRGAYTVDRFAILFRARQIPRFNSKWLNPATEGIDHFMLK